MSEAAIRLAQNHQLEFSSRASQEFFKIYGPGKALNFPGFDYTKNGQLITQFPRGYISWLAAFYSLFGLNGLIAANAVAFFIFLLSFYLVLRRFLPMYRAFAGLILFVTSFVFSWFFKFTIGENLAITLVWFGSYSLLGFMESQRPFQLFSVFLSFGLLLFVRVEAPVFFAIAAVVIFLKFRDRKRFFPEAVGMRNAIALGIILILFAVSVAVSSNVYTTAIKGALKPLFYLKSGLGNSSLFEMPFYIIKVLIIYSLLGFFILGIPGIIYSFGDKKLLLRIPFLATSPAFFYLLQPAISSDHPWMLRRFLFAVIPVVIFYSFLFLDRFFKKALYFFIFSGLAIFSNLFVSLPFFAFSPNQNLLPQIEKLSSNFDKSDLVLVDRNATGDGWSMMTGPISFFFGKQAVYFFNPADLEKIDLKKFSNTYLIVPDNSLDLYRRDDFIQKFLPQKKYDIQMKILDSPAPDKNNILFSEIYLPEKKDIFVPGKIYLLKKQ